MPQNTPKLVKSTFAMGGLAPATASDGRRVGRPNVRFLASGQGRPVAIRDKNKRSDWDEWLAVSLVEYQTRTRGPGAETSEPKLPTHSSPLWWSEWPSMTPRRKPDRRCPHRRWFWRRPNSTARASSPRGCRDVQVRGGGARHHRWRWIRPLVLGATWVWQLLHEKGTVVL